MKLFLAGAVTGNLINHYKDFMRLYLAGLHSEQDRALKGLNTPGSVEESKIAPLIKDAFVLESFFYIEKADWMLPLIPMFKDFLLDSGAFTFMSSSKNPSIDWNEYVIRYGNFVKKNDIKLFLELDIDSLVGIAEVERLRVLLEKTAGRKCIPVWHKSRGLDYWRKMTKEYDYVAIGGIVTREIKKTEYGIFPPLLRIARENGCRVHGLGFTNLDGMKHFRFYSVDSTSWLVGNKFGIVFWFDGKTIQKQVKKSGQKIKNIEVALNNFSEWLKYSKYAEHNL